MRNLSGHIGTAAARVELVETFGRRIRAPHMSFDRLRMCGGKTKLAIKTKWQPPRSRAAALTKKDGDEASFIVAEFSSSFSLRR